MLNTQTGLVSPQFHVVFDDNFDTVGHDAKFESLWQNKAKLLETELADDHLDRLSTQPDRDQPTRLPGLSNIPESLLQLPGILTDMFPSEGAPALDDDPPLPEQAEQVTPEPEGAPDSPDGAPEPPSLVQPSRQHIPLVERPVPANIAPSGTTRSGRRIRPPRDYSYAAVHTDTFSPHPDGNLNEFHPLATLKAFAGTKKKKTSDPDTMTLAAALLEPDADNFIAIGTSFT